jgi:hypothetical protein
VLLLFDSICYSRIGEVTRLNRDITAPKIKEYLNLNVSTYTILRASKLFEWNKLNPNSNEAKKQAAMERQLNGEPGSKKSRRAVKGEKKTPPKRIGAGTSSDMSDVSMTNDSIGKEKYGEFFFSKYFLNQTKIVLLTSYLTL